MEGWLTKRGAVFKTWRRRWFVLTENALRYGQKTDDVIQEVPVTSASVVVPVDIPKHPYGFSFKSRPNTREFLIAASSETERNDWVKAISAAIQRKQQGSNPPAQPVAASASQPDSKEKADSQAKTPAASAESSAGAAASQPEAAVADLDEFIANAKEILAESIELCQQNEPVDRPKQVRILTGHLEQGDEPESSVFRMFVSSTFTDTKHERDFLMQQVYPLLRGWLQSNFGISLEVVDMRWGVRDEATDEHQTSQLCMRELGECQRLSRRLCFISLQSEKYGYRPFPSTISSETYLKLRENTTDPAAAALMDEWFEEDANATPCSHKLKPIGAVLGPEWRASAELRGKWWSIFETLQLALREAAVKVLPEDEARKFVISVTEDEFEFGVLHDPMGNKRCAWFHRTIVDVDDHLDDSNVGNFVDMVNGQRDPDAKRLVEKLVTESMTQAIPDDSRKHYDVHYGTNGIDPQLNEAHKQYIYQLSMDFLDVVSQKVISKHYLNTPRYQYVYDDAIAHLDFARSKRAASIQPQSFLDRVRSYLKKGEENAPLVLCGPSGSGKTVAAAHVAFEALENKDCTMVARFVGVTAPSADLRTLLRYLCAHLHLLFDADAELKDLPFEIEALSQEFSQLLSRTTAAKPIVVIIDSLDQLDPANRSHELYWLPAQLPPHARLIVSTLIEDDFACFPALQNMVPESAIVRVNPLKEADVPHAIELTLGPQHRTLTADQAKVVSDNFSKSGCLPLYLAVALQTAQRWSSSTPSEEFSQLPTTIPGVIQQQFDRLERYHGEVLVKHALGFITGSRFGLSETELFRALDTTEPVLQSVFQYWTPPDRKIPPLLWARIYRDLGGHLVKRGRLALMGWYHRQFRQEAEKRYLPDEARARELRQELIEIFEEEKRRMIESGELMLNRVSDELPWLYMQTGETDKLIECISEPRMFGTLRQKEIDDHNFDLRKFWQATGLSATEIGQVIFQRSEVIAATGKNYRNMEDIRNYGQFLDDISACNAALAVFKIALDLAVDTEGEDSISAGSIVSNTSLVLRKMGNFDESIAWGQRSLEIYRAREGEMTSGYATELQNLASVMLDGNRVDDAEPMMRRAVEIYVETDGENALTTAGTLYNLGIVCRRRGQYEEAIKYYKRAYAGRAAVLGPNHPSTAEVNSAMAASMMALGQFERAKELFESALTAKEAVLGPDDLSVGITCYSLAMCLANMGLVAEALDFTIRAFRIYSFCHGPDHPHTKDARGKVYEFCSQLGQLDRMPALYEELAAFYNESFGATHQFTLTSQAQLAWAYHNAGDDERSRTLFAELAKLQEQVVTESPDDQDALIQFSIKMYEIGSAETSAGFHAQAINHLDSSLSIMRPLAGNFHTATRDILSASEACQQALSVQEDGTFKHDAHKEHSLERVEAPKTYVTHGCDICSQRVIREDSLKFLRCHECDYDQCTGCTPPEPHPHTLEEIDVTTIPSFTCDECEQHVDFASYRCSECDYDMCNFCFVKPQQHQQQQQQNAEGE